MSDRKDDRLRDFTELEKALAGLPGGEPDEAFRERLRRAFVSGAIAPAKPGGGEGARRRRRVLLPLAAAAAILAAVIGFLFFRGGEPGYQVLATAGTGDVVVDGRRVPLAEAARMGDLLAPGVTVRVPATGRLDLAVPGTGLFELAAGTTFTLPGIADAVPGRLTQGEVRFASGPGFPGHEMTITTPEGLATVTGTVVSVQRDGSGTCVCVLEGTVRVGRDGADLEAVPAGRRKVMAAAGGTRISPAAPPHRAGLSEFLRRTAPLFAR